MWILVSFISLQQLILQAPLNPRKNREKVGSPWRFLLGLVLSGSVDIFGEPHVGLWPAEAAEIFFETFGCPALFVSAQACCKQLLKSMPKVVLRLPSSFIAEEPYL